MTKWIASQYKEQGVILMTASGLEVSRYSPFYGPHVGSYYNMLFKKALLGARCPTVLFLDERKLLGSPFQVGTCYPVCDYKPDKEMDWGSLCKKSPVAIAVGCASETGSQKAKDLLISMGLETIDVQPDGDGAWLIIASNEPFAKLWETK